jgi:hypothetical protein
MSTKKTVAKKPEVQLDLTEVQLDESPSIEEKLQGMIDALNLKNDELKALLIEKDERIEQLGKVIDVQSEDLDDLNLDTLDPTAAQPLRTTMLMAMLPQVRIDYPRPDAQKAAESVNVIMEVWGLSDED